MKLGTFIAKIVNDELRLVCEGDETCKLKADEFVVDMKVIVTTDVDISKCKVGVGVMKNSFTLARTRIEQYTKEIL